MKVLMIDIAGIRLRVSLNVESALPYIFLKKYLQHFVVDETHPCKEKAHCCLGVFLQNGFRDIKGKALQHGRPILKGDGMRLFYNPLNKGASLFIKGPKGFIYLYNTIYLLIATLLASKGGCIFHGAGIGYRGKGCIFIGPSGAGKTTIANLFRGMKVFEVLGDEAMALKGEDGGYVFYPTPFGARGLDTPLSEDLPLKKAPLSHIFVLKKGKEDYVERLGFREAFSALLSNIPYLTLFNKGEIERVMSLVSHLSRNLVVSNLYFTKSPKFLKEVISCD